VPIHVSVSWLSTGLRRSFSGLRGEIVSDGVGDVLSSVVVATRWW
jgi:hypothetical protein